MTLEAILISVAVVMLLFLAARLLRAPGTPSLLRPFLLTALYTGPLLLAALLFHSEPWFQWFAMLVLATALARFVIYPVLIALARATRLARERMFRRRR